MKDIYWVIICTVCVAVTFGAAWTIAASSGTPRESIPVPNTGVVTPGDSDHPTRTAMPDSGPQVVPPPSTSPQVVLPTPTTNTDLVITGDHVLEESDGSRFIAGNITNKGGRTYSNLNVNIDLYDVNGTRLTRLSYIASNIIFRPGETRDFEAIFLEDNMDRYTISSVYAS